MHFTSLPITDQIFTHIDPDTKIETVFAVDAIRRYCETWPNQITKAIVPLTSHDAAMIMERRGIEAPRLRRAMKTKDAKPLLFLSMPDRTHLLIDGSHTYVALVTKGHADAKAYIVEQHIWSKFIVIGIPTTTEDELLKSWSGIQAT